MQNNAKQMTQEEARAAADRFLAFFEELADVYIDGVKRGTDERIIFEAMRDQFASRLNVPEIQAANLVRVVIALIGKRYGKRAYKPADFRVILCRAFNSYQPAEEWHRPAELRPA